MRNRLYRRGVRIFVRLNNNNDGDDDTLPHPQWPPFTPIYIPMNYNIRVCTYIYTIYIIYNIIMIYYSRETSAQQCVLRV